MRKPESRGVWEAEVRYARTTSDCDKHWWCRYLDMQIKFCKSDGFADLAAELELCKNRGK